MRRNSAVIGTTVFFVLAPGTVAGLIPWWLSDGWHWGAMPIPLRIVGALLIAAGLPVLLHAFYRFVTEGLGTPAPIAPTQHLVVGGLYRYVRNPMYVAVAAIILGQALLLGSRNLFWYAVIAWAVTATFVKLYEEPTLLRTFGAEYEEFRRNVPAWIPRVRPWAGH